MKGVWVIGVVSATKLLMIKLDKRDREENLVVRCENIFYIESVPSQVLGCWYIYTFFSFLAIRGILMVVSMWYP